MIHRLLNTKRAWKDHITPLYPTTPLPLEITEEPLGVADSYIKASIPKETDLYETTNFKSWAL